MVVIGSPIAGSSLSWLLKLFGRPADRLDRVSQLVGVEAGLPNAAPLYSRDPRWYEMMERDISRVTLESFLLSIASLRKTDLSPSLTR